MSDVDDDDDDGQRGSGAGPGNDDGQRGSGAGHGDDSDRGGGPVVDRVRNHVLSLRVSAPEKAQVLELRRQLGYESTSDMLRALLGRRGRGGGPAPGAIAASRRDHARAATSGNATPGNAGDDAAASWDVLNGLEAQIRGMAGNVNQAARSLHLLRLKTDPLVDDPATPTPQALGQLFTELRALSQEIRARLDGRSPS